MPTNGTSGIHKAAASIKKGLLFNPTTHEKKHFYLLAMALEGSNAVLLNLAYPHSRAPLARFPNLAISYQLVGVFLQFLEQISENRVPIHA